MALCSAGLVSCGKPAADPRRTTPDKPRLVNLALAELRPMERVVTVTGSLAAWEQTTLSVKVAGRLKVLAVDLGSAVEEGDVLAQVEPRDYELRLQQAAAALAQARALVGLPFEGTDDTFDPEQTSAVKQARAVLEEAAKNRQRVAELKQQGIAPASEFDTAEASYIVALNRFEAALEEARTRGAALAQRRAEYELARQQLADTSVRAPFDGVVQARIANLGEFLSAGSPVVALVKTDPLRLRLEVPERQAMAVRVGQVVRLRAEGDTDAYIGRLTRLSPAITEQNRMLIVEADVPHRGALRPGLFARAEIVTEERDEGIAVPPNALIVFAGLEKVVTVREGKAVEKTITTGRRGPDWLEVVHGLKPGEPVVLDPGNLRTGQPVHVAEASLLQTTQTTNDSSQ
jgi:RND family efflux transporter MFP subunit